MLKSGNLFSKAQEAALQTDIAKYKEELSASVAEKRANNDMESIIAGTYDEIKQYIPSFDIKYSEKLFIIDDRLVDENEMADTYITTEDSNGNKQVIKWY